MEYLILAGIIFIIYRLSTKEKAALEVLPKNVYENHFYKAAKLYKKEEVIEYIEKQMEGIDNEVILNYEKEQLSKIKLAFDHPDFKPKNRNDQIVYHGGCLGCKSQNQFGLNRCVGCKYFLFDNKPNLFIE